jgi:hypothetical protein
MAAIQVTKRTTRGVAIQKESTLLSVLSSDETALVNDLCTGMNQIIDIINKDREAKAKEEKEKREKERKREKNEKRVELTIASGKKYQKRRTKTTTKKKSERRTKRW